MLNTPLPTQESDGQALNTGLEDIFDVIGAGDIPPEEKGSLLVELLDTVQTRVIARVVESLDDVQMKEFEAVIDRDDPDGLDAFLAANAPGFADMYKEEGLKLRKELIDQFAAAA